MDSARDGRDVRRPGNERPCWLEIDLAAVRGNVQAFRAEVGPTTRICAVVKAGAYGLGAAEIGRAALDGGAAWLAVARVVEGVSLRRAGLRAPILVLGGFAPAEVDDIVRYALTPTVVQPDDAVSLARAAARVGAALAVHLKVDTGLTRFGCRPDQVVGLARLVVTLPPLRLQGLYTHFASADDADPAFTAGQLAQLRSIRTALASEGIAVEMLHAANSAGAIAHATARLDMVRLGITLSGHYPSDDLPRLEGLRPAVAFRARLLRVDDLETGETVGYGRTFRADRPMRVGLVAAGYADGVPRAHSNRASVLAGGLRSPIIGRVSMDQCVVDVTGAASLRRGDDITLFGSSDGVEIGLDEFAAWSGTIGHEALCRIGARVPRLYRDGGEWRWGGESEDAVSSPHLTGHGSADPYSVVAATRLPLALRQSPT